jgi:hypothetical protein
LTDEGLFVSHRLSNTRTAVIVTTEALLRQTCIDSSFPSLLTHSKMIVNTPEAIASIGISVKEVY